MALSWGKDVEREKSNESPCEWVTAERDWVNINHIWLLFSISHCLASNGGFIQDNIPYVPIYCRNHEYLKDSVYYTYDY